MELMTVIQGAAPFVGGLAAAGGFKEPINSLNRLWYNNFGYKSELKQMKHQSRNEFLTDQYKNEFAKDIVTEVIKIGEKDIKAPTTSIAGPAMQNSEFYLEDAEIRKMFAKLIAASMDKRKEDITHPSFSELIKQLSPKDALFLQEFKTNKRLPFAKILSVENKEPLQYKKSDRIEMPEELMDITKLSLDEWTGKHGQKSKPLIQFFYYSENRPNFFDNEFSISSLQRLGLIEANEGMILSNKKIYREIESHFKELKKNKELDHFIESNDFHFELRKGAVDLTPIGFLFFDICV